MAAWGQSSLTAVLACSVQARWKSRRHIFGLGMAKAIGNRCIWPAINAVARLATCQASCRSELGLQNHGSPHLRIQIGSRAIQELSCPQTPPGTYRSLSVQAHLEVSSTGLSLGTRQVSQPVNGWSVVHMHDSTAVTKQPLITMARGISLNQSDSVSTLRI